MKEVQSPPPSRSPTPAPPPQSPSPLSISHADLDRIKLTNILQRDEITSLKAEVRAYRNEIASLSERLQTLEAQVLQDAPALNIGREVRLRYMEKHRQRIGRSIGRQGYERIKAGDRAAHRGRPVPDAMLCIAGLMPDREAYKDLYGISPEQMQEWMGVPEIVEVAGFRASLQSEGRLNEQFQKRFELLVTVAKKYATPAQLKDGLHENHKLQSCYIELQHCYDKIVAESRR